MCSVTEKPKGGIYKQLFLNGKVFHWKTTNNDTVSTNLKIKTLKPNVHDQHLNRFSKYINVFKYVNTV